MSSKAFKDEAAATKKAKQIAKERGVQVIADNGLHQTDEYNAIYREVVEQQKAEKAKSLKPKLRKLGYDVDNMIPDNILSANNAEEKKKQEEKIAKQQAKAADQEAKAAKQRQNYNEIQDSKKNRAKPVADGSGTVLSKYIDSGTKLESSLDLFNENLSQGGKATWFNSAVNNLAGGINAVTGKLSDLQKNLADLQSKYNVDKLLSKMGLGDNAFLKALAGKFGLKSGLLDSWASDIVNVGMSWANSMLGDIGNSMMQSLCSQLKVESMVDNVILNSIVKPLRYAGANPNYKNTLLRSCLESDLPKCLDYLDGYNGTQYIHTNNMYNRAIYSAKQGCISVVIYICKKLNEGYTKFSTGSATDNKEIAYWYKSKMVEIFKTVLVYGYSNFDTQKFSEFISINPFLKNYSYYGDNDTTFNNRYRITSGDINKIAKIVNITKTGNEDNQTKFVPGWNDPGAGTTIDISNITHEEQYIDVRNIHIKELYILMAKDPNIPNSERLVNENLHKRLKYPIVDMIAKANSTALNTMLDSKTYNDLRYLFDTNGDKNGEGLTAGLIHNALQELKRVNALRTTKEIWGESSMLNKDNTDIGDFKPYTVEDDDEYHNSVSSNTTITQSEEEQKIDEILDKVSLDPIFKQIGLSRKDFAIIDTYGLNETDKNSKISNILNKNKNYQLTDTFVLTKWDNKVSAFIESHTFMLYCTNPSKYSELTTVNKDKIRKQILAIELVRLYASTNSLTVMKTWYGTSKDEPNYEKDKNGNIVYDANGVSIFLGYIYTHRCDIVLAEYLDNMANTVNELKLYFENKLGTKKYTVKFDNQGLGETCDPITNITPYSTLANYNIKPLTDKNNHFVFLGWVTKIGSSQFFDFQNNYITKDITLYAVWEEAKTLVLSSKLKKEDNASLEQTIYATIDNQTGIIWYPIKEKEMTSGTYIISLTISDGATCDVNSGQTVYITANGDHQITVKNIYGVKKIYTLKAYVIPETAKRITYLTDGGDIGSFNETMLCVVNTNERKLILATCTKESHSFDRWFFDDNFTQIASEIDYNNISEPIILRAKYDETKYRISYSDAGGTNFSGEHEANYPIYYTYNNGAVLDNPEKEGFKFLGYYTDPACADEYKINNIPKYHSTANITVYAKWMSAELYELQANGLDIDGVKVKFDKIVFYNRYIVKGGNQWVVTNTGLAIYTNIGDLINRASVGTNCTPLGISYLTENDTFLCLTKTASGKIYLYKSKDRGVEWEFVTDITGFKFNFFTGTGFETLEYLTFFLRILYQGMMYEIKNNEVYIDDTVIFGKDNIPELANVIDTKSLGGISITIDGAFYLLFINDGIYKLTLKDFEIENILDPEDPTKFIITVPTADDIVVEKLKEWNKDETYKIDTASLGTAYNNIDPSAASSDINDDFDIDDESITSNILRNAADKYIEIKAHRNASRISFTTGSDGKQVPVYEENSPLDWVWIENPDSISEDGKPPALWLSGYKNRAIYRPNITNPIETIILNRKDTPIIKENTVDTVDIFEYHEVTITRKNYKQYIGWMRKDELDNEILLTQTLMDNTWKPVTKTDETWMVKLDKREAYDKSVIHPDGSITTENVYKGRTKEIVASNSFNEYSAAGLAGVNKNDYVSVITTEQEEKAQQFRKQYTVSKNANGTKRYDGITEEFYKYITDDYQKDKSIQLAMFGKRGTGTYAGDEVQFVQPNDETGD